MEKEKTKRQLEKEVDDKWAKENGFTLVRDTCSACNKIWDEGGDYYCGPAHAYEVGTLKKGLFYKEKVDKLLSAIDTNIMSRKEAEKLIGEIEDRWY